MNIRAYARLARRGFKPLMSYGKAWLNVPEDHMTPKGWARRNQYMADRQAFLRDYPKLVRR